MSLFSGVYDLCDHIMMEKHRTKEGSCKREDLDKAHVLYSDELECFEIFKEKTGGVIHQHHKIEVTKDNLKFVAEHCPGFIINEQVQEKGDKTKTVYTYTYYGTEYPTLKALNKHGVYIILDIHFDTLLDIIPYYPYVVSMSSYSDGKEIIYVSSQSKILSERDSALNYGRINMWEDDTKKLQEHYIEVCRNYFLYQLDERTKIVPVMNLHKVDDNYYSLTLSEPVDYMHPIEYVWTDGITRLHWANPKLRDQKVVLIHRFDVEQWGDEFLNETLKIKYVAKCTFPLYLT